MTDAYLGINLDEDEKRKIRVEAAEQDVSMSEFARNALSDWLEENATEQTAES